MSGPYYPFEHLPIPTRISLLHYSTYSARMNDTVHVVDAYYPDEEGHKVLKEKKVKFTMALNNR